MQHLARREHTRAELQQKLQAHVQEGDDLQSVLDELEKRNWLSDARAATQLVDAKRSRFGSQRIAQELRQRGVDDDLIAEALPDLKALDLETAREVWQRKFGKAPQEAKEKARQMRFLQSRGFSTDVILKVLKSAGTSLLDEE
ncbi:MAG: recombination regulator RecX [Sideroxydans sp.]|nr:recombination regulator RecX [Sideroxydans sp.]